MADTLSIHDFPSQAFDKIRYADTDRQGHVNNSVFSIFLETGRVEILQTKLRPLLEKGLAFAIARLVLDFRAEIMWPGEIRIGTRVANIGRSSMKLEQALFQGEKCVATAETVIVLMDETTRRSTPLPPVAIACLSGYMAAKTL